MLFMFLLPAEEPGVAFFDFQRAEPTRVSGSGALCLDGGFDLLASVRSIMLLTSMKPKNYSSSNNPGWCALCAR